MAQLECHNVSVEINGVSILEDISFEIEKGEFVSLLGPNGAGKTTLMKAIAGLLDYQGRILIGGNEARDIAAARRGRLLSYIPQMQDVHWPMRVYDIVALGRLPYRTAFSLESDSDNNIVTGALEATDLAGFSERQYDGLSGGEKGRVMISRALASQAPLMLADEPTAALDPFHQLHILEVLRHHVEEGLSVIAILHDILLSTQFSDRVILMNCGQIKTTGKPDAVLTPENLAAVYGITPSQSFDLALGIWKRI